MSNAEEQKEYEISFLLKAESDRQILEEVLSSAGAVIGHKEPAKEIRLAYPIKKHLSAHFGFDYFKADPAVVKNIQDSLKLKPEIIRFIVLTPPIPIRSKREEGRYAPKPVAPVAVEAPQSSLSNEALSQKLEEILK